MELVEIASEDLQINSETFIQTYADIEAYTSCDDEGDDFHECDFFNNYLGPTKWLHLTPKAQESIDEIHFRIWKDVWSHPRGAVDLADKVSKECLRYVLFNCCIYDCLKVELLIFLHYNASTYI